MQCPNCLSMSTQNLGEGEWWCAICLLCFTAYEYIDDDDYDNDDDGYYYYDDDE
jgi:ribosomal protein L37AE/L43A